ncbi:MAG: hypothetical protein Q8K13_19980, partial [Parvibaculum sp.]|uniref:hypothetical protein n=1 Tax=Parvibaculum sp. TaxID=2024848 RepID=UPI002731F195
MGVSLGGLQEAVDRCESEIGEFEIEGVRLAADPDTKRLREPDRDPVLGAADGGKRHRLTTVERFDQLAEGALIDEPNTAPGILAGVQALGGVEHVLVKAFREEEAELFCRWGHRNTHAYGYGARIMSLLTSTRTGQPARTRRVGWRLRSRPVICWP